MPLVLFDIDGTLLNAAGAGVSAMVDAGRELFGSEFSLEGVEIAGRLDPLIYADATARCGVEDHEERHERFRLLYGRHLASRLAERPISALPGAGDLVLELQDRQELQIGLLTGNYPETGRLKLAAAGLDASVFTINAFGSDGRHRRDLPPVAIDRYRKERGEIEPEQVVIIGDTPHDVDCAAVNGCRCIGVGTGRTTTVELREAGADLAVDDLSDTSALVRWISTGI